MLMIAPVIPLLIGGAALLLGAAGCGKAKAKTTEEKDFVKKVVDDIKERNSQLDGVMAEIDGQNGTVPADSTIVNTKR